MTSITQILSMLINLNSTSDTGDTEACAAYAASVLYSCGIDSETVRFSKGKHCLIAKLSGRSDKVIILHAHLDTAPYYKESGWRFPADRASFIKDFICGRGAVDCKSQAAVWISIMCEIAQRLGCVSENEDASLKSAEAAMPATASDAVSAAEEGQDAREHQEAYALPEKGLMLVLTCDEESGGEQGLKRLLEEGYIEKYAGDLSNIELVIGEGGGFPVPFKDKILYTFQTGEFAEEEEDISEERVDVDKDTTRSACDAAEASKENEDCAVAKKQADTEGTAAAGVPELTALQLHTVAAAVKKGYYSELIYEYMRDCGAEKKRLDTEALYKGMSSFFEKAPETNCYKRYGGLFLSALRKSVPNAELFPVVTPGYSDNRYFRRLGIPVIGFFPFYEKDHIIMHGANEYISRQTLELSHDVIYEIVSELIKLQAPEA